MDNKIKFTTDEGETVELYVLEETKFNGCSYLLAAESEDDEAVAYIMKQVTKDANGEVSYEFVEDDKTIDAVAGIFEELLDGEVDLVGEDEE